MKHRFSLAVALLAVFASGASKPRASAPHRTPPATAHVQRDAHRNIKRSSAATTAFKKQTGYPKGRPGYVIDHKVPLKRGGADKPSNMQWQTKAAAKAKDKRE